MTKNKTDRAAAYARRLFNVRPRSESELKSRLFQKGFGRAAVTSVVSSLRRNNIIDDRKFAKLWVESRMRTNPKGRILLRKELAQKGISAEVIDEVLTGNKETEEGLAREIAQQKRKRLKNLPKEKARKKLFDSLARKGFDFDIINSILSDETDLHE